MREEEKSCLRCEIRFKPGDRLLSVHDFLKYGNEEFVSRSMRFVHETCPTTTEKEA